MADTTNAIPFFDTPNARRLWLLAQALRSLPLDRALELGRSGALAFQSQTPRRRALKGSVKRQRA
jgi:hypothetical protein